MPETNMIFSWNRDIFESSRVAKLSAVLSLIRGTLPRVGERRVSQDQTFSKLNRQYPTIWLQVRIGPKAVVPALGTTLTGQQWHVWKYTPRQSGQISES